MDCIPVKHGPQIDLSDWSFPLSEVIDLDAAIAGVAKDAIANTLAETPPYLSLPFVWTDSDGVGGPAVSDPLVVDVALPFGGAHDGIYFRCSMRDLLAELRDELSGDWSDDDAGLLTRMAKALREEADLLEAHAKSLKE